MSQKTPGSLDKSTFFFFFTRLRMLAQVPSEMDFLN